MKRLLVLLLAMASLILISCELISSESEDEFEFSIFEAWWSDEVDEDGDGYYQFGRLNFDIDVDTGTHLVWVRIYYRTAGMGEYSLYYTTSEFEITEYDSEDAHWVAIGDPNPELNHGDYDFLIRVYSAGGTNVVAEAGPEDESSLAEMSCEPSDEDGASYSVYNTWWTDVVDQDDDEYARSANLNFDIDISTGSDVVFVRVYKKLSSASDYVYYAASDTFTIVGYNSSDENAVAIGGANPDLTAGYYDFKVEVLRYGTNTVLTTALPVNDSSLGEVGFEPAENDGGSLYTYSFYNVWWANTVDNDDDGYHSYGELSFDVDVNSGTHSIYARISFKNYLTSTYTTYYTTASFDITGYESGDTYWVAVGAPNSEPERGIYDFKIEIFDANTHQLLVTEGPEDDSDLDNVYIEPAADDGISTESYSVYNAWWTDTVDNDEDGYTWYRKLNMDIDCSSGTHNIYVKVFYKLASVSTYSEYFTTGLFSITEYSTGDAIWVAIGSPNMELTHALYDFKIEVFREGGSVAVATEEPAFDSDLDDNLIEYALEDGANDRTFDVYDAWWSDDVDADSDGYSSYRKINFDIDVSSGSYPVYVRVYYKTASASSYTTYFTTGAFMITGYNSGDSQWVAVGLPNTQLAHNTYDFKLEVYIPNSATLRAVSEPGDDASLDNQDFEPVAED